MALGTLKSRIIAESKHHVQSGLRKEFFTASDWVFSAVIGTSTVAGPSRRTQSGDLGEMGSET